MFDLSLWPWSVNAIVLLIAAGFIALSGVRLAAIADRLADRTGLGEAVTGVFFLGLTTALPGLAASVAAALDGHPALAISNAIGGIAIQTTFLAIADLVYTKANLEHAAVSVANMIQTAILISLLTVVLLGLTGPEITIAHVHPITLILFLAAGAGFWLVFHSSTEPMWKPKITSATVEDIPDVLNYSANMGRLIFGFVVNALAVTAAGAVVAHTSGNLVEQTGLNETVAGVLFSGIATSLPELVTTVASVRRGALTLAVSDIVGGNFFDVLFVFAADLVYLHGSIYHAKGVNGDAQFLTSLAIFLNIILLLGLLFRHADGKASLAEV